MTNSSRPDYSLADPREVVAEAPYTFFLPSNEDTAAVGKNDSVKLIFEYIQQTEKWTAERMWVVVSEVDGDFLRGNLDNQPEEPTSPLQAYDPVEFQRHHIIDIQWDKPGTAPRSEPRREYWERCTVDECVLNGTEPVGFLWREEPTVQLEEHKYPDSGWVIRGRMGSETIDDVVARKVHYVALGAVLNRDDSWLHLIDAPIGSCYTRNFETNTFVEDA